MQFDGKYFGTDGIRGRANCSPMTAMDALQIGMVAGGFFRKKDKNRLRVVIGKDTRRSGYMIESALTAGLTAVGMNVLALGPVPTPGVGLLTRSMRAAFGLMISASHNLHFDNGIKFFGPDGFKLSDDMEAELESLISRPADLSDATEIGSARRIDDGLGRYIEFVKTTFPKNLRLNGLRVVVDCANGAAYKAAPQVLWELGAEVVPIAVSPNGFNINEKCGSTHVENAISKVQETRADIGISLDGDADRIIVVDEKGKIADGDQLLALLARRWADNGRLARETVVTSVMSNMALERYLQGFKIKLERSQVGDRQIVATMRKGGFNLGGEQSGHIVMSDYTTTGDGLIAGLQFLAALVESNKRASEVASSFVPVPQTTENLPIPAGLDPLERDSVKKAILDAEKRLETSGRVLVRKSGTEPLIRIMAEGEDQDVVRSVIEDISNAIKNAD